MTHFLVLIFNLESTDLEKVTVKSLDEIKREKEQRLLQRESSSTTTAQVAHATRSHDAVHVEAGGPAEVPGKDKNSFGKISIACRHCTADFELKRTTDFLIFHKIFV